MFSKFAEISPVVWGILGALVIVGVVLFFLTRDSKKWTTRMLANAALVIALSFILSYIRLYKMPQGGSITLASMLPIFMFAYAYGVGPGMLVGMAYGVLQFIQDAYFVHPVELLLDYPNVEIYDYSSRLEWITDLDNYFDYSHHSGAISDAIMRAMAAGENRVTSGEDMWAGSERIRQAVEDFAAWYEP